MNLVVFDFEVFKHDVLLGCLLVRDGKAELFQTWDTEMMKMFYIDHVDWLWVGHNIDYYDNAIMKAVLEDEDPYRVSKSQINATFRARTEIEPLTYDLMCCKFYSLKMTELLYGKKVHTTDVDFEIDRKLTDEEKKLEEDYNADDLYQSFDNFAELKDQFLLRLALLNEFDIPKKYITATEARLAAMALKAKQIPGLEYDYLPPKMYDTLRIKNQNVIDFYMSEAFRRGEHITEVICGIEHNLGAGGIHAAIRKYHGTDILYLDVSGYYNLVMMNYDLLPRTIPQEGKELYNYMYHEQLRLKGIDNRKRGVYKTILLSVFGASTNKYTDFYDPNVGTLITITGQIFLVDLLEKLDGKALLIQSNTDGIMIKPLPGHTDEELLDVVKEWCDRTKFVIKPKRIKELWQRDVNCYMYLAEDGHVEYKGDVFVSAYAVDEPVLCEHWSSKYPACVSEAVLAYFKDKVLPEETIMKHKDSLKKFQLWSKKGSYDYCMIERTDLETREVTTERTADIIRVFPMKITDSFNVVKKVKTRNGKTESSRIPEFPDNVFVWNDEILSEQSIKAIQQKLDYDYYIEKSYKLIEAFISIPKVKEIL